MMNLAWVLTAAVVIFVEKAIPGSHRLARPLGVLMIVGGVALLGAPCWAGWHPGWNPCSQAARREGLRARSLPWR
jgi:hypothetical protein